ncbi:GDSL-type esterase/lipase family protein [Cohnella sp. GCM10027633]|uniref:GDSL-type esterase/lipase family protein n=1 Tax=unclassified Cohnella TaxID=2636738 RepID=UPI00363F193D
MRAMFAKIMLMFAIGLASTIHYPTPTYASTTILPADANMKYFGRWDKSNPSVYSTGRWPGAYLKVNFSGTTIQVVLGSTTTAFEASIDDGPFVVYGSTPNATINLTPVPLANGTHSLVLVPQGDGSADFQFAGLELDDAASTQVTMPRAKLIEFVGDSITVGYGSSDMPTMSYPWRTAESINAEHVQISHGGMCLPDGYSCTGVNAVGMISSFFNQKNIEVTPAAPWNFTDYTPSQVVVNIGTNDGRLGVPDSTFQNTYITLLTSIRAKYPSAPIFVIRPFGGYKALQAQNAAAARNSAGDANVFYVDTTGWLTSTDYLDTLHPNDNGVQKIVDRLGPILNGCSPWGSNLARCETYSASSQWDGNQSANLAFDGLNGTNWQAAQYSVFNGQWLEVNFGERTTFNQAVLAEFGSRTTGFRIEYWNGGAWATAYTGTAIGSLAAPSSHSFPAVTGSKARIYYTSGSATPIMYEFKLHNTGSGYTSAKAWNFNTNANVEGWSSLHLNGMVSNNAYTMTAASTDMQLKSPDLLAIAAPTTYNKVRIRMLNASPQTAAKVYFITNSDVTWSETKSVAFPIVANSGYADYIVDMSGNASWTGTIRQLRIDPLNPSASGQSVVIDYIRVTN